MTRASVRLAFVVSLLGGCALPPVEPGADPRQARRLSRIEGEVVVTSRSRGNVIVLLYDADHPPPPKGSGRPRSFTVVPAAQLFGAALGEVVSAGPFVAPYRFSQVPPGRYVVRAFLDRDECLSSLPACIGSDFIPWYGVTAEPNRGDVVGAAVDAVTQALTVVTLSSELGPPPPVLGLTVIITDATTVPADRPAFTVAVGDGSFVPADGDKVMELVPSPINEGPVHQRQPVFLARYVDEDGDGTPDDANADGVPDFFPRVVVRKLAEEPSGLLDENDLDRDGVVDSEGVDYERQDGTKDGRPDAVVLSARVDPDSVLPALTDGAGNPRLDAVPVARLRVILRPQALDASLPAPTPLARVPPGRYSLTVVQFTGQTWRVPNELQPELAPKLGLPAREDQAFVVDVR